MSLNRETVFVALANLVFSDPRITAVFATTGRLLPHVQQVDENACPGLFMFQRPETRHIKGKGIPPARTLHCAFVAYFSTETPGTTLPATAINAAADVIDQVINDPDAPTNPGAVQTLGGLVEHVTIEPTIEPFEGLLQEKSVLVASVAILVP